MGFRRSKKAVEKCWVWEAGTETEVSPAFIMTNSSRLTYDGWFRDHNDIVNHYWIRYPD